MEKLNSGDEFPEISLNITGGGTLNLPNDISTSFTIVLFYRGHW